MALPTTLITPAGPITMGATLTTITITHNGHTHDFTDAQIVAFFPYGDDEVRYEIQSAEVTMGVTEDEVSAFSVI